MLLHLLWSNSEQCRRTEVVVAMCERASTTSTTVVRPW